MDEYLHPIEYDERDYLSMTKVQLIYVSKRGPRSLVNTQPIKHAQPLC